MKGHLLIVGEYDAGEMRQRIVDALKPEFEWLGKWIACEPAITGVLHRGQVKLWLQPMLWNLCGAPVPYSIPVRFSERGEAFMRHIEQFYRQNYRMAPVEDRLATFAASMASDEKPKRRKKGGAA